MKEINIHICMVLGTCGPENGEIPGINVNNLEVYLHQHFKVVHKQSN